MEEVVGSPGGSITDLVAEIVVKYIAQVAIFIFQRISPFAIPRLVLYPVILQKFGQRQSQFRKRLFRVSHRASCVGINLLLLGSERPVPCVFDTRQKLETDPIQMTKQGGLWRRGNF